jgi:hypothetical protein
MMDEQGKKTGIDIDKAKAVVEDGKAKFETASSIWSTGATAP